jgi:hypothetical protein
MSKRLPAPPHRSRHWRRILYLLVIGSAALAAVDVLFGGLFLQGALREPDPSSGHIYLWSEHGSYFVTRAQLTSLNLRQGSEIGSIIVFMICAAILCDLRRKRSASAANRREASP